MLTRDQKIAFAEFLLSEKQRHQDDIDMIDQKLEALAYLGIVAHGTAPWITTEDLLDETDEQFIRPSITDIPEEMVRSVDVMNASPFGGYWRYQLDCMFDNSTGEDIDGLP